MKNNNNSIFWIKFFLFVVCGFLILWGYGIFKVIYKKHKIKKEVENLRHQVQEMEQRNQKLKGSIEYFKSLSFSQKEAKEKLNVKKEGEKVIMIKTKEPAKEKDPEQTNQESGQGQVHNQVHNKEGAKVEQKSNSQKWWDYFFS
ncbi:MAG: hypothetical protein GF335_03295 [Candidatus Moranbacteria bacterium]|nr:hypothetical protein [Candidatus Moranbacteria bacterium]